MKKILVIDDEKDFCFLIKKVLERSKVFKVATCSDSEKAMETIKNFRPDLVLLDIMMPNIDGTQIAERIKEDSETKDIPFIFLTALVTGDEIEKNKNIIRGEYFLSKPVKTEELLNLIKTLIE